MIVSIVLRYSYCFLLTLSFGHGLASEEGKILESLLRESPQSVYISATMNDVTNGRPDIQIEYKRSNDDFCLQRSLRDGVADVVVVKDSILFGFFLGNFRESKPGEFKLLEHNSISNLYASTFRKQSPNRGGQYFERLMFTDADFAIKLLVQECLSSESKRDRIEVRYSDGDLLIASGLVIEKPGGFEEATLRIKRDGKIQSWERLNPVTGDSFRHTLRWDGEHLVSHRFESRTPDSEWFLRSSIDYKIFTPNAEVHFDPADYGFRKSTSFRPVGLLLFGVGFLVLVLTCGGILRRKSQPRTSAGNREGVTLLELMVVIAVITLLVSIGLPAIQSARESSRRTACKENCREIGLALSQHETAQRSLPSCGWGFGWYPLSDRTGASQPGGWIYPILPHVEQSVLFSSAPSLADLQGLRFERFMEHARIPVSVFRCPSKVDRSQVRRDAEMVFGVVEYCEKTDYALSGGTSQQQAGWPGPRSVEEAESAGYEWPHEEENGIARRRFGRKLQDITDGLSNTLMLGEKQIGLISHGFTPIDDHPLLSGLGQDTVRWTGQLPEWGFAPQNDSQSGGSIFGGPHPSVTVFVFCDGSVHSVSNSLDRKMYARLGHISDGKTIPAE